MKHPRGKAGVAPRRGGLKPSAGVPEGRQFSPPAESSIGCGLAGKMRRFSLPGEDRLRSPDLRTRFSGTASGPFPVAKFPVRSRALGRRWKETMKKAVILLVVLPFLGAAGALNAESGQDSEKENNFLLSGRLSTRYRAQWNQDDTDHDLLGYLSFDLRNLFTPKLSLHGFMRGGEDLDDKDPVFDVTSYEVRDRVYDLYFEAEDVIPRSSFRVGRQYYDGLEGVQFDGVRFMRKESNWLSWEAFGGKYRSFYNRYFREDCEVAGAQLTTRPFRAGSLSAEYLRLMDFPTGDDDYLNFAFRQHLDPVDILTQYSLLNGESKDVSTRLYWLCGKGWEVSLKYYHLFQPLEELSNEFDPYYPLFGAYMRFHQYDFDVTKYFGEHVSLSAGYTGRQLVNDDDEGIANREFDKYYASFLVDDVLIPGFGFSATFERWLASEDEDDYSVGGELSYRVKKKLNASVGTYYSKYKYNVDTVTEKTDVRTWYARLRYYFTRDLYLSLRGEREDDRSPESPYGKVELRMTYTF